MNSTTLKSILAFLEALPNKRFARFAAVSRVENCPCVMGALYDAQHPNTTWVIQDVNGTRWANDHVASWAERKGLTFEIVLWLIDVNDFDTKVFSTPYIAETPAERYARVTGSIRSAISTRELIEKWRENMTSDFKMDVMG